MSMEGWKLVTDIFTAIGSMAIGAGTLWLAYTGQAFRKDKVFENKFNLAKEAIRIFNHLRNDIQKIRSPFGFEGEINRLKALPEDNELVQKMKKHEGAGLALLRMNERSESLAEMNRLEPEFRAVFGDTEAFENMRSARHAIWVATTKIVEGIGEKGDLEIIWSIPSKKDDINSKVNQAVAEIEELCKPVLAGNKK